jgi:hypothetical protein
MCASAANTYARSILLVALDERGLVPEPYAHGRDLFLIKRAVAVKYLGRKPASVRRRNFWAARPETRFARIGCLSHCPRRR